MTFISPTGSFYYDRLGVVNDAAGLVKVQIENSLELGWKPEDILLFTNFDYEYGIIKANVLTDVDFFEHKPQATKINTIVKLFDKGLIKKGELYWHHDLDVFQLEPITDSEINLPEDSIALTDYGRVARWNTGTLFFKSGSKDIFERIKEEVYKQNTDEEHALGTLTRDDRDISKRVIKINKTYNFTPYNLRSCYKMADKPLKIVHFHPLGPIMKLGVPRALDFYMGENKLHIPLITGRLLRIFKFHRIR